MSSNTRASLLIFVSIEDLADQVDKDMFYYLKVDHENNATLFHCYNVPEGMLTIVCSSWWFIVENKENTCSHNTDTLSNTLVDPKVAFENY